MMNLAYVTVPRALMAREINGYSETAQRAKDAFHRDGQNFLRAFAAALGLAKGTFDVRSNKAGMAVSGEVTLHSDDLYLQLSESTMGPGVRALYRSCSSRKDYCGHQNNFAEIDAFVGPDRQLTLALRMQELLQRERERKASQPA